MEDIKLSQELAQRIVDRTRKVIDYNINIRDKEGRIIASGMKERINTVSDLARKGIEENEVLKVAPEKAKGDRGMEAGVQIPINFNGKILGAVDITGRPEEVEVYVGLVKMTVELMLQQAFYLKQLHLEQRAEEQFIIRILQGDMDISRKLIEKRAELLDFKINEQKHLVWIIEVNNLWEILLQKVGRSGQIEYQRHQEILREEIREYFRHPGNLKLIHLEDEKFVLINTAEDIKDEDYYNKAELLIEGLNNKYSYQYRLALGSSGEGFKGIRSSFSEAKTALSVGRSFYPERSIYYYRELLIEKTVKEMSPSFCRELAQIFPLKDELQKTLEEYFASDLNISRTAKRLSLHRNSVMYRLQKISKETGFNYNDCEDLFTLKLALLSYKLQG